MVRNRLKREQSLGMGVKSQGGGGENIIKVSSTVFFCNSCSVHTRRRVVMKGRRSDHVQTRHIAIDGASSMMLMRTFTRSVSSNTIGRGTKLAIQVRTSNEARRVPQGGGESANSQGKFFPNVLIITVGELRLGAVQRKEKNRGRGGADGGNKMLSQLKTHEFLGNTFPEG